MKEKIVEGVTINGKAVVIYQLKLIHVDGLGEEILTAFLSEEKFSLFDLRDKIYQFVELATNLTRKEFQNLYFEEIEICEKVFLEVNAPLFRYSSRIKKFPLVQIWLESIQRTSEQAVSAPTLQAIAK